MDGKASEKPFDINGLNEMYGKETVGELLQMSVDESRGLLDQIAQGIAERDSKIVMNAAHTLKGLASTMTIDVLADLSFELEKSAKMEQFDGMPAVLENLEKEYEKVAKYVAEVLA